MPKQTPAQVRYLTSPKFFLPTSSLFSVLQPDVVDERRWRGPALLVPPLSRKFLVVSWTLSPGWQNMTLNSAAEVSSSLLIDGSDEPPAQAEASSWKGLADCLHYL